MLLTTFSEPLALTLQALLRRLVGTTPQLAERIDVVALDPIADRLHRHAFGRANLATTDDIARRLEQAAATAAGPRTPAWLFGVPFLLAEWKEVVDAWQLDSLDAYRGARRLGRRTRLAATQREAVWPIFVAARESLARDGLTTHAACLARLTRHYESGAKRPFDFIIVDEAQDVSVAQLRLLASLGAARVNGLFFAGDTAQRIFEHPFSWRSLGVEVRGRARTLRVNFRAVAVIACDDEVLPLQARIDGIVDEGDLAAVYESERQLLYVAVTRARDRLLVCGVLPVSEFLRDLA